MQWLRDWLFEREFRKAQRGRAYGLKVIKIVDRGPQP